MVVVLVMEGRAHTHREDAVMRPVAMATSRAGLCRAQMYIVPCERRRDSKWERRRRSAGESRRSSLGWGQRVDGKLEAGGGKRDIEEEGPNKT